MGHDATVSLLGREAVVRQVAETLAAGRSVLLFGPEGIGKSAIIAAIPGDHAVIDPFERVSRQAASRLRRALDRGAVYLAATRAADGRALGAVGRILWRFSPIRVRELSAPTLARIVRIELRRSAADVDVDPAWVREVVRLARGRPGFAVAMVEMATEWRRRQGYLPAPALAFAAMREDAVVRALRSPPRHATARAPQPS